MKLQALLLAVTAAVFLAGCSSGPAPPEYGSPAYTWNQARTAYRHGDLAKANELLSELQQTENVFTPRARIWQIVLAGGLTRGYSELADGYASGERLNRADSLRFHRQVAGLRGLAAHTAMDFTQAVHLFVLHDPSPEVQLGFDLPPGTGNEPVLLRKPYGGTMPPEAEMSVLETAMVEHGVIGSICLANGVVNDTAQLLGKFQAEVKTPRATFLYAAAKTLFDVSDLFGYKRMDEPQHVEVMCQEALKALQSIPETTETMALTKKIQSVLKKPSAR